MTATNNLPQTAIRLFAFDIDGVLTDGRLYYAANGERSGLKVFHVHDGMGLSLLKKAGIRLAAISGRGAPATQCRLEELGVEHIHLGVKDKAAVLGDILTQEGISTCETVFMGDDLIDISAMNMAGLAIAPGNALSDVKEIADFITELHGGMGAVREAAHYVLRINNIAPLSLLDNEVKQ
ncbi:MAG: 3-deoxy-D-manno-octulosonate 8-phosphate phosphatase (KDO 8-P phosphatase) [Paraglaciecola sp.]|jgi:3-deoxy-D-manno-octulosonate 8-phosphate phosphatase (KDO 8-P phosphatase)